MSIKNKIANWGKQLSVLEGIDRLQYLVDLADKKTSLPNDKRINANMIPGCVSQIWVDVRLEDNKVIADYDSDAMITKGITSVVCDCFTGATKEEVSDVVVEDFEQLNIKQLLTAQRQNGLGNLINTVINKSQQL
ncbi:MAG: Fe-S metabolism protein SufE [Euryarchaeota archaeon]|jgi:cysteine desulfuration protein SufE|nr:Fe-S metabolism protein SufE [Euryarchaeota archaeon]